MSTTPRRSARPTAFACIAFLVLTGDPLAGQGSIEILEPQEWRADAQTRNIVVRERSSVRIRGVAHHPDGIESVTIDGRRATVSHQGGNAHFIGYAAPAQGTGEVVIRALTPEGLEVVRRFPVQLSTSQPTLENPGDAWTSEGFRGQRWAVVIGISEYRDTTITPLRYADQDARAFYDFLVSERAGLGGFDPANIRLLLNEDATNRNVRLAFRDFLKGATEDDVVLVYFAGHGAPDRERPEDLYLITHDTDADRIAGTAFPMDEVNRAIRRTFGRSIISITDACHSAGVGGQTDLGLRATGYNPINDVFLDRLESTSGSLVAFTASQVNQYSQESSRWGGGHGVFTYYLLQGLEGRADEDGDRIVTLGELLEWTRDRVRRETRNAQIPSISQTSFDHGWPMSIVLEDEPPLVAGAEDFRPPATEPAAASLPDRAEELALHPPPISRIEARTLLGTFLDPLTRGAAEELTGRVGTDEERPEMQREFLRLMQSGNRDLRADGLRVETITEMGPGELEVTFSTELRWRSAFGSTRSRNFLLAARVGREGTEWSVRSFWIVDGSFSF